MSELKPCKHSWSSKDDGYGVYWVCGNCSENYAPPDPDELDELLKAERLRCARIGLEMAKSKRPEALSDKNNEMYRAGYFNGVLYYDARINAITDTDIMKEISRE